MCVSILRRVASYLVLVVVDVNYFNRFGVGRGLLFWGIFFPTVASYLLVVVVAVAVVVVVAVVFVVVVVVVELLSCRCC